MTFGNRPISEAQVAELAAFVRARAGDEPIRLGLILGSGLGHIANALDGVAIPYDDLPGFPHAGVSGHNPKLVIGTFEGQRVAVLGGRSHYYEHGNAAAMRLPIALLKALGAESLILTNAAGSVRAGMETGSIMCLSDHINFTGLNPLIGEPTDARFVPMTGVYDADWRATFAAAAKAEDVDMADGVYAWFSGPSFETPAEIRMIQIMGADAVGMSTVPEVILARFYGLRVGAISAITNMGAGLSDESLSHEHTKAMAPIGAAKLEKVLRRSLRDLA